MPPKVIEALPISDPLFKSYKLALVKLRCQLEVCSGDVSEACAKYLKGRH